jgi:hypothetical protein
MVKGEIRHEFRDFWRYNGRTDWADRADTNGFFSINARISSKKSKKIRSYPPDPPNPFFHCIALQHKKNSLKDLV